MILLGTRPELVKTAEAIHGLRKLPALRLTVIFTGQHDSLIDETSHELKVLPDIRITPMPSGRSLTALVGHLVSEMGNLKFDPSPTAFAVHGDTASVLAASLVSELEQVPLIHIEAGVRSGSRDDPFPEETIRRMVTTIAEHHICFSETSRQNLLAEQVPPDSVSVVSHPTAVRVDSLGLEHRTEKKTILITMHRRERRVQKAKKIVELVDSIREDPGQVSVTFVWHPALDLLPNTLQFASRLKELGVEIIDPVNPSEFIRRIDRAGLVITDSAGTAEEAMLLRVPLLEFRETAERRFDDDPIAPTFQTEQVSPSIDFVRRVLSDAEDRSLPRSWSVSRSAPEHPSLVEALISCVDEREQLRE